MCHFNLNMNTEGWLCCIFVTSSVTSSAWDLFFMHNLHMVFPFLKSCWSYIEQVNFLKREDIWRSRQTFSSKVSPEISYVNLIAKSIPCILSFCSTFYLKNLRSYGNFKIWLTFLPGDLVSWPTSLPLLLAGTSDSIHMCTKFGDDTSKHSWVMLDKTDRLTDRQMDRQTDRQTNILAKTIWQVTSCTDGKSYVRSKCVDFIWI